MNKQEHLFTVISEECHEIVMSASAVGQIANKILRFGLNPMSPDGKLIYDNMADLIKELNDLTAALEMLQEEGMVMPRLGNRDDIDAKKAKVRLFLQHSRNLGTLTEQE